VFLNDNSPGNFDDLLDPDFQDHVIEVIKKLCAGKYSDVNASFADLLETDISEPIKIWISEVQQKRKEGYYSDIKAAEAFAIRADNIVYILRYKTRSLYPEYVDRLNDAWSEFQRSIAYHLRVESRILRDTIDNFPDLGIAVAEELQRRSEEEKQKSETRKRERGINWHLAGKNGATKYKEVDRIKWLEVGKQIIKENRNIKSIRELARQIREKTNYSSAAEETIRKTPSIINIIKQYLKNNIG
jgi:hypothetical protein